MDTPADYLTLEYSTNRPLPLYQVDIMQSNRRNLTVVSVATLVNHSAPLITFALLVRAFDPVHYGLWIEANTLVGLLIVVCASGLADAIGALIFDPTMQKDEVFTNGFWAFLLISGGLAALMVLASPLLDALTTRNPTGAAIIPILAGTVVTGSYNLFASQVFRLRGRAVIGASFDIAAAIARIAAIMLAFVQHDLISFAAIYVTMQLAVTTVQVYSALHGIRLQPPSWPLLRSMLGLSLNFGVVSQSRWFVMYGDRLLLSILSTSMAVAVYSASYQITMILIGLGWPYLYMLLPALGAHWQVNDLAGAYAAIRQATRSMTVLLVPAVVGLALTGDALLRFLATESFAEGAVLIGIIGLGVAIDVLGTSLQYLFHVQKRPQVLRRIFLQSAAFNLAANLVAIPLLSFYGAGITTLLTFVLTLVLLWRETSLPVRALLDVGVVWRCLIACIPMGFWVAAIVGVEIGRLLLAVGGGALVYGAGVVALGVIRIPGWKKTA